MKALFYFLFGIVCSLFAFVMLFDAYAPVYFDDYYLDIMYTKYAKHWWYGTIIMSAVFYTFIIIWLANLKNPKSNNELTVHHIHEQKDNDEETE